MLVPLSAAQVPSRGGTDERIDTPGAVTSGLNWSPTGVGPLDEKYAIGATPETGPRPATACVPKSPAAIPATWSPWSDSTGSYGSFAYFQVVLAGANTRATITFGLVECVAPFGKPGGYEKPVGVKKGCARSIP